MEYRVKVSLGRNESVSLLRDGRFAITVDAPREEGRANDRARALLADHLGVPHREVRIVSGHTSTTKTFAVPD